MLWSTLTHKKRVKEVCSIKCYKTYVQRASKITQRIFQVLITRATLMINKFRERSSKKEMAPGYLFQRWLNNRAFNKFRVSNITKGIPILFKQFQSKTISKIFLFWPTICLPWLESEKIWILIGKLKQNRSLLEEYQTTHRDTNRNNLLEYFPCNLDKWRMTNRQLKITYISRKMSSIRPPLKTRVIINHQWIKSAPSKILPWKSQLNQFLSLISLSNP